MLQIELSFFRLVIQLGDAHTVGIFAQKIYQAFIHPDYKNGQAYYDLAILKISYVEYDHIVTPLCIPVASDEKGNKYEGRSVVVAGWGSYNVSLVASETLRTASMTIHSSR